MSRERVWVIQRSGNQFWVEPETLRVGPIDTSPEEIARGLAGLKRFSGHSDMTVAEHSVIVSRWAEADGLGIAGAVLGLMHDAPEAFGFGDINGPLKRAVAPYIRRIEDEVLVQTFVGSRRIQDLAMRAQFWLFPGGQEALDDAVHRIDKACGTWERHWSFPKPKNGPVPADWRATDLPPGIHALYLDGPAAERLFLDRFEELECRVRS